MNTRELIKKYNGKLNVRLDLRMIQIYKEFIHDLQQLDEPQKVVVPQFVADWIEYFKKYSGTLYGSTAPYSYYGRAITDDFEGDVTEVLRWIRDNSEVYARAWLFGYEVEKEPKYTVKIKGINGYGQYLNKALLSKEYFFASNNEVIGYRTKHTRKELKEVGFGWVFDCDGVEVEEVE